MVTLNALKQTIDSYQELDLPKKLLNLHYLSAAQRVWCETLNLQLSLITAAPFFDLSYRMDLPNSELLFSKTPSVMSSN